MSLKDVFESHGKYVKIDTDLIKRLREFESGFVNANEDHVKFFGGNLLGTHQIKFKVDDFNLWWDSVTEIDDLTLQDDIWNLPNVDRNHKVSTNVFNLSCIWLIHKIKNSNLSENIKQEGMLIVALILQYKLYSSVLLHMFPYATDEATAEATYARLSRKFDLKRAGSWKKLMVQRGSELIENSSLHSETFSKFSPDDQVLYAVSDIQTRVRQTINGLTDVFYEVRASETKSQSIKSKANNLDGEEVLRDVINNDASYIRYVKEAILDKDMFIQQQLVDTALDVMRQGSEKQFKDLLVAVVSSYRSNYKKLIDELIEGIILHAVNYIRDNPKAIPNRKDLVQVISTLRGLYLSSKTSDRYILQVRDKGNTLVKRLGVTKNKNNQALLRNTFVIYVLLLAFTKDSS